MKIMKTITRPASTEEVVDKVLCDICKERCKINNSYYTSSTYKIEAEYEESYPDTGHARTLTYDLCKDCFYNKVVPAMKQLGATFEETKRYW